MLGWDRKIRPEDHRLASRGQTEMPRDEFFYPILTQIMDSFSRSQLFFLSFKNKLLEVPEYNKIQSHMMTSLLHDNDVP